MEAIHILKFKPRTVEKHSSANMYPPAEICVREAQHWHCTVVGWIRAGGSRKDDEFLLTVPSLDFDQCMISTQQIKRHSPQTRTFARCAQKNVLFTKYCTHNTCFF